MQTTKNLNSNQRDELLAILKTRFDKNMNRHKDLNWSEVQVKLEANPQKLLSLFDMENTGGEPDVIGLEKNSGEIIFYDCSAESPAGRRSVCYDREAWEKRKTAKPKDTALDMANEMGIELLTEEQYMMLQKFGEFDLKTSSWLKTPVEVRKRGGAIFGDRRFGRIFIYHNGADSYYAARGFRGLLRV